MKKLLLVFPIVSLLAAGCGSASQPLSQQPTPTNQAANAPQFQTMTIGELVSDKSVRNILVKVQGRLSKKGEYVDKNTHDYFLKIMDISGSIMIMSTNDFLSNYYVGDILEVKGAVGSLDCSAIELQKICQEFSLAATSIPVIIPIPSQTNNSGIEVIEKSSATN